jgi:hypothetical protein
MCPTHERPLTVHGECMACERAIERAESRSEPQGGWEPELSRYERHLDTMGGSR